MWHLNCTKVKVAFEVHQQKKKKKKKKKKRLDMGVPDVNKKTEIIFLYEIRFGKELYFFIGKGFMSSIGIASRKCQQK